MVRVFQGQKFTFCYNSRLTNASRHGRMKRGRAAQAGGGGTDSKKWEKVLYKRQPYPDNYVDTTFLASLITNANVTQYEFWATSRSTAVVVQQVSALCIFFLTFKSVHSHIVPASWISVNNAAV